MNNKIKEYRTKHKKCKWCKYYKYHTYSEGHCICSYGECLLKDKIINWESIPRLCKWYELKEDNNEVSINKSS